MLPPDQRHPDTISGSLERQVIEILWSDGHNSTYDFDYLRWNCPCAFCHGEGGIPGVVNENTVFTPEQTTLVEMAPVGNYAMSLTWADGHSQGIYTFEALRLTCPCRECDARRKSERRRGR